MSLRLEGVKEPYEPTPDDPVHCETHNVTVQWRDLDAIQQLAVEEGLDTGPESTCILAPVALSRAEQPK